MPRPSLPIVSIRVLLAAAVVIGLGVMTLRRTENEARPDRPSSTRMTVVDRAEAIRLPDTQLAELLASPTIVVIDGVELCLDPFVFRNRELWLGPADHPEAPSRELRGSLSIQRYLTLERLHELSRSNLLPRGFSLRVDDLHTELPEIVAEQAWILRGDEAWATSRLEPDRASWNRDEALLVHTVGQGPDWPLRARIVIVIRVRDETGRTYLLRSEETTVQLVF